MNGLRWFRDQLSLVVKIAVPVAAVGLAIAVPAEAASTGSPSAKPAPTTVQAARGPVMIAPLAAHGPSSPAQLSTAAATCVRYATRAGWANNGYYAGDLVTAAAICVAESAGDPKLIVCDKNGVVDGSGDYPGFTCPSDATSYDRGLWQLNSVFASDVSNQCAFSPVCNAGRAYLKSGRGTSFSPWSSYDQDVYAKYIDAAQTAVTNLHSGTVTSALLGECLQATSSVGAKVVIANCGSGGTIQQWIVSGGKLRSGSLCAAISSTSAASPGIVLRKCAAQKIQQWSVTGRFELRNNGDGKCLTDPNSSLTAGTQVNVTRCVNAKNQTWWLP
jgi:Ricin-type beta-trefoil lectin domain/Lysozyme like domain